MTKYWHAFNVFSYKGGELCSIINTTDVNEILDFIITDYDLEVRLDELEDLDHLTDDELYDIFCSCVSNQPYAFESSSAPEIYTTSETGKLVIDFPSEKDIVKYMHNQINNYKKWKSGQ